MRSALQVLLAGALTLALAACSVESTPSAHSGTPGKPRIVTAHCLDLERGGQHLALDVVGDLHALDIDSAALNADFSAGHDINVEQLAWVLLGVKAEKNADGEIFVYATERTPKFPATKSMQRTIFESSGSSTQVKDLDLGQAKVAGLPAESAAVTRKNGEYDAWTFTSGNTRFIVYSHQLPDTGPFDLSAHVPGLFKAGGCADS